MSADPDIGALMARAATSEQKTWLRQAAEVAAAIDTPVYLVGGAVRDLLRAGEMHDLDLVVVGDGQQFARLLAGRLEARLRLHERFRTAELWTEGLGMDVVTARREDYPQPASLPDVSPGTLADDLARRDYTVNCLAVPIWPAEPNTLIDPFGGRRDLAAGRLKVLHARSFYDDPTRILRGVRLASRLDFEMDRDTHRQAVEAIQAGAFSPLSRDRLRHEIVLLLDAPEALQSLRWLERLGFLPVLGLASRLPESAWCELERLASLRQDWAGTRPRLPSLRWWLASLIVVAGSSGGDAARELAGRLGLDDGLRAILLGATERLTRVRHSLRDAGLPPHRARRLLDDLAPEEIVVARVQSAGVEQRWLERWIDDLRLVELRIGGADLIAAGWPAGPEIGRVLAATLDARIDGRIGGDEELDFALALLAGEAQR